MRRQACLSAAALALAAAALFLPSDPSRGRDRERASGRPAAALVATSLVPAPATAAGAVPPGPAASLGGTERDGALETDASGNLRMTPELRRFFDYFLTASGEEDEAVTRARIQAAARARLARRAADQAEAALDRYLAFRRAARALGEKASDDLAARLSELQRLRREYLPGPLGDAFFGEEELLAELALARQRALTDPTLSDVERRRLLDEIEARTPPEVRASANEATRPLLAFQREEQLRAAGASAAEIERARIEMLGTDAAARLAALDRERAVWSARLDEYRTRRDALERTIADPTERAAAIEDLLARLFTAEERLRVDALDRIDGVTE